MSEVERDGIRDVSGGSREAEQRGIRAAKRGERENVSNMNERGEYRNQNAEAPTTSAFDAPQVPPGIAPAANDEGASAGVISHNAPRQLNPMGKAIAVVLSVLLVLTCWNSYSIEEARRMIIGDDAVPMASTGSGDELLDEVDDENIDQASNDVEGDGDAAEGDDASGGEDADDTAADDTVSEADMQAYLPKDLLDAEKVMPALADATLKQEKDGILTPATTSEDDLKAAFANRFSFSLAVANALRASDDAYHVGGTNLAVAPSLGNTNVSFDGGYLGGAEDNDAVVLTFEAPFLYKKSDGTYGTTLSEEEQKARGAAADDMRALFAVSSLPAGWTVFTKHGEQYQKRTAEELAAGLSGTIVLRYEGVQDEHGITVSETRGQMPAGTELPRGFMWLTEAVPATEKVSVNAGFALCSYTPAANEDGTPKGDYLRMNYADAAAATAVLVNAAPQASLDASLAAAGEPVMDAERGFASYLLTLKSTLGAMTEDSYTLRVSDLPDTAEGKGKLSADAVVAFDATDLTDEELASVNPADPATIEALGRSLAEVSVAEDGVADITFATEEGDALALDAVTGAVDGTRVLYVAVPYAAADLTETEDGAAYNAEEPSFMLWSYETAKAVQEEKVEGAESVNDTLADEKLTFVSDLGTQSIAFPKPAAPEPEPEPEPADEPTDEQQPADEPATDEPAEGTDGEEPTEAPAEEEPAEEEPAEEEQPADFTPIYDEIGSYNETTLDMLGIETMDDLANTEDFGTFDPVQVSMSLFSASIAPFSASATTTLAPSAPLGGALTETYFNPNLVAGGVSTSLGGNTYLVNDKDTPTVSMQIIFNGSTGYMGGWSRYPSDYYGTMDANDDGLIDYEEDGVTPIYTPSGTADDHNRFTSAAEAVAYAEGTDHMTPTTYTEDSAEHKKGDLVDPNCGEDKPEDIRNAAKLKDYNEQKDAQGFYEMGTRLTLNVPYLYKNDAGGMDSTYSYTDWRGKKNGDGTFSGGTFVTDGDKAGTPAKPDDYPLFAINFGNNTQAVLNNWSIYLKVPNTNGEKEICLDEYLTPGRENDRPAILKRLIEEAGPEAKENLEGLDLRAGLTGQLVFEWHGAQKKGNPTGYTMDMQVSGQNAFAPNCTVAMLGNIPENAGGSITYGGTAHVFTNAQAGMNFYYYPLGGMGATLTAPEGQSYNNSVRKITLLKTNLTWETSYEPLADINFGTKDNPRYKDNNVLFDRYNYMVYKVTTKNTSSGSAEIDYLEYFFTVHNTEENNAQGITKQDLMQFMTDGASIYTNPLYPKNDHTTYPLADYLTYDANGGSGTMGQTVGAKGGKVTVSECGFVRQGMKFAGWSTQPNGGAVKTFKPGDEFQLTNEDDVLYAQWIDGTDTSGSTGSAAAQISYVGVPNQGGVLIYDTTNWLPKDYEALDMRDFSNIDSIMKRADNRPVIYDETYKDATGSTTEGGSTEGGSTEGGSSGSGSGSESGKVLDTRTIRYDTSNDDNYKIESTYDKDTGAPVINAKSIPYQTNNQSGRVNFTVAGEDGGHLYPNKKIEGDGNGEYSFIIAVPYTTNINETVGFKGNGYYVDLDPLTTIFFGKLGVGRDYSWSDSVSKFSYPFGLPQASMTGEKMALEQYQYQIGANGRPTTNVIKRTTPVQTQNTSFSYLGQMVTYEIGNMKTVGNMPLYGEDSSSTTAGPIIVDTLPNYFRLYNLEFVIEDEDPLPDDNKNKALDEWFDTDPGEKPTQNPDGSMKINSDFHDDLDPNKDRFPEYSATSSVAQFQIMTPAKGDDEDTYYWINLGAPQYVRSDEVKAADGTVTSYKHIYRLGGTTKDTSLASLIEARHGSSLPGISQPQLHEDQTIYNFTGNIRMVMNTPIDENKTLPVTVRVNGTMTIPLADYKNAAQVDYGKRMWNYAANNYASSLESSERSEAAFNSAASPNPKVSATAVAMAVNLFDATTAIGNAATDPNRQPILNRSGAGWRFQLDNSAISVMEPATFTVGNAYGAENAEGFSTQRIGISQDLIDNSIIDGITINYRMGTPGTPTALKTEQAKFTGDALKNLLESHQAYIVGGQRVWHKDPATGLYLDAKGNVIPNQEDKSTWKKDGIVITPKDWLDAGYFVSMTISFEEVGGKETIPAGSKMYVEVQGTPEELDTMEMSGTFGTAYENFAAALAGRNVSARATASFTSRKAPYKLQVTTTGMRESQVPGDPNAFVANLEYARDNNGNIYYTDAAGNRGIIENGTFKYGKTESVERRKAFDAATIFPLYRDSEAVEGKFDGTNFLYMDANDEQQTKAFDVREVEGVTATPAYLDTEGHRGTLSGTTFTYEVDVTKEIQEDFLFEAATDPYVNGVLLSAKTTTDGEGNTSYVFDNDGHMIYVDGSGNEGYVNGNDFVLADGSTLSVTHQQRTDGAGHDLYIDREGHEGYIADGLFTYEYSEALESGGSVTKTGTKHTSFTATGNKVTVGSDTFDEYTNWEGSVGYVTDDGWFVYSKTVKEERTKTVSNVLTLKRDAQKRVLYSDGTYEGTKDGNQFVYFELVDNTTTKPVESSMQPVVEKDDAGTNKLFEGYIGDPGSGWRITVGNDSSFDIGDAVIKAGVVLKESQGTGKAVDSTDEVTEIWVPECNNATQGHTHSDACLCTKNHIHTASCAGAVKQTTKIDYKSGTQTDFEASAIAISPALWMESDATVYVTDQCTANHNHTKDCPGAVATTGKVRKGGIPSDLRLNVFTTTNSSNVQVENAAAPGGTAVVIPGLAFRTALSRFANENLYTQEEQDAFMASSSYDPNGGPLLSQMLAKYAAVPASYGITVEPDGRIVVTLANCHVWKNTYYLRGVEQTFTDFGSGLTLDDGGYLDIFGTVTNKDTMWLGGVFSTNYANPKWNSAVDSLGVLNGAPYPADGTPHREGLLRHARRHREGSK